MKRNCLVGKKIAFYRARYVSGVLSAPPTTIGKIEPAMKEQKNYTVIMSSAEHTYINKHQALLNRTAACGT